MIGVTATNMCRIISLAVLLIALSGCSKSPDIQGAWYFDYEATRITEFPNPQYESARILIADLEPRFGTITVDGDTIVLGGAVCKVRSLNDARGLHCDEHGVTSDLGLFLQDGKLVVKPQNTDSISLVFSRIKLDPFTVYGVDPSAQEIIEDTGLREEVAVPIADKTNTKLVGYARTQSFNAFFESDSVVTEGRYTTVRTVLNYLEPQGERGSSLNALSSVQTIAFDCPGSNYKLERYVMMSEPNGQGEIISDSGNEASSGNWVPVPENSVNKVLYMKVCRK